MIEEISYYVDYCLHDETYFESQHERYDPKSDSLTLTVSDIGQLVEQCTESQDSIGVSLPTGREGTYDALEIHGINGRMYDLKLLVGKRGGFLVRRNVPKRELMSMLTRLGDIHALMATEDSRFVSF